MRFAVNKAGNSLTVLKEFKELPFRFLMRHHLLTQSELALKLVITMFAP